MSVSLHFSCQCAAALIESPFWALMRRALRQSGREISVDARARDLRAASIVLTVIPPVLPQSLSAIRDIPLRHYLELNVLSSPRPSQVTRDVRVVWK